MYDLSHIVYVMSHFLYGLSQFLKMIGFVRACFQSFQRAIHSNSTKFYELISVKFRSLPVDFQFDRPEPEVRISTGSSGVTGSDRNSGRLLMRVRGLATGL